MGPVGDVVGDGVDEVDEFGGDVGSGVLDGVLLVDWLGCVVLEDVSGCVVDTTDVVEGNVVDVVSLVVVDVVADGSVEVVDEPGAVDVVTNGVVEVVEVDVLPGVVVVVVLDEPGCVVVVVDVGPPFVDGQMS